ncbi:MAG: GH3 auxin-responsive promoter family protein, partial [Christiangramia sp.]
MAIFGSIIKSLIDLKGSLTPEGEAVKDQEEVLRKLLKKGKDTEFGKHYKFAEILTSEDIRKTFSETVPYFDYNKMDKEWWHKYHEGKE